MFTHSDLTSLAQIRASRLGYSDQDLAGNIGWYQLNDEATTSLAAQCGAVVISQEGVTVYDSIIPGCDTNTVRVLLEGVLIGSVVKTKSGHSARTSYQAVGSSKAGIEDIPQVTQRHAIEHLLCEIGRG